MTVRLKYCFSFSLFLSVFVLQAQPSTGNQAVVNIFGNSVPEDNNSGNDNNPYIQNSEPPAQQKLVQAENKNIEPTLENGFHMRFEISSSTPIERMNSGYASAGSSVGGSSGSYGKAKKHTATLTERSFNFKKKVKTWLPKRKKKYRPHLCGRF